MIILFDAIVIENSANNYINCYKNLNLNINLSAFDFRNIHFRCKFEFQLEFKVLSNLSIMLLINVSIIIIFVIISRLKTYNIKASIMKNKIKNFEKRDCYDRKKIRKCSQNF